MLPHHTDLEELLRTKTKGQLVAVVSEMYQLSHGKIVWELYDELIYEVKLRHLHPFQLRHEVDTFYSESLKGKYYTPFVLEAQNFNTISEATGEWFSELSMLLGLCCELVFRKEPEPARYCFAKLFDLIERAEGGEEIIFAHVYGEWMITCRHDYKTIFRELQ